MIWHERIRCLKHPIKNEISSKRALRECGSLLPIYRKHKREENSFRLLTNHSKDSLLSQHYMDVEGRAKIYLNERMIKKFALEVNKEVLVISKKGKIRAICTLDNGVQDFVALMYVGWWEKHGNPNFLLNLVCLTWETNNLQ